MLGAANDAVSYLVDGRIGSGLVVAAFSLATAASRVVDQGGCQK